MNGLVAMFSLVFLCYYSHFQLRRNFQTKRFIMVTYIIEGMYLMLSIWAWVILAQDDPGDKC
jgi:hypothetical protein